MWSKQMNPLSLSLSVQDDSPGPGSYTTPHSSLNTHPTSSSAAGSGGFASKVASTDTHCCLWGTLPLSVGKSANEGAPVVCAPYYVTCWPGVWINCRHTTHSHASKVIRNHANNGYTLCLDNAACNWLTLASAT